MLYLSALAIAPPSGFSTVWNWKPGTFAAPPGYLIVPLAAILLIIILRKAATIAVPVQQPSYSMVGGPGEMTMQESAQPRFARSRRDVITDILELLLVAAAISSLATLPIIHALSLWTSHLLESATGSLSSKNATVTVAAIAAVCVVIAAMVYIFTETEWATVAFGLLVLVVAGFFPKVQDALLWVQTVMAGVWNGLIWFIAWLGHFTLGVSGIPNSNVPQWAWKAGEFADIPPYLIVTVAVILGVVLLRRFLRGRPGLLGNVSDVLELLFVAAAIASLTGVTLVNAAVTELGRVMVTLINNGLGDVGGTVVVVIFGMAFAVFFVVKYHRTHRVKFMIFFGLLTVVLLAYLPFIQPVLDWVVKNPLSLIWYFAFWAFANIGKITFGVKGA